MKFSLLLIFIDSIQDAQVAIAKDINVRHYAIPDFEIESIVDAFINKTPKKFKRMLTKDELLRFTKYIQKFQEMSGNKLISGPTKKAAIAKWIELNP